MEGTSHARTDTTRTQRAARVRAARAYADLDQRQLGEALGKSVYTVKRLERGMRDISDAELQAVAKVCKVPLSFLVTGFADQPVDLDDLEPLSVGTAQLFFADAVKQLAARLDELEELVRTTAPNDLAEQVAAALNVNGLTE